jgi:hypothetical protein
MERTKKQNETRMKIYTKAEANTSKLIKPKENTNTE